jgi:hypothetical protein
MLFSCWDVTQIESLLPPIFCRARRVLYLHASTLVVLDAISVSSQSALTTTLSGSTIAGLLGTLLSFHAIVYSRCLTCLQKCPHGHLLNCHDAARGTSTTVFSAPAAGLRNTRQAAGDRISCANATRNPRLRTYVSCLRLHSASPLLNNRAPHPPHSPKIRTSPI